MKARSIPVELCDVPPVRVTAVYDEEQLALLRGSLAAMGPVQPIIVLARDGRFEVVDGLHRLEEARSRGETRIDAVVYEGDAAQGLLLNLVLNRVRGKTKASEMVAVIGELTDKHGLDSVQIGEKTGLPRDYIERLQVIAKASPSVREALDREAIGVGVAYEIARLPAHAQQEQYCAEQQIWRRSTKEVRELVDQVLEHMRAMREAGPAPAAPAAVAPPIYHCDACQQVTSPNDLRPIQICPRCFASAWQRAQPARPADAPSPQPTPPP